MKPNSQSKTDWELIIMYAKFLDERLLKQADLNNVIACKDEEIECLKKQIQDLAKEINKEGE